MYVISFSLMIDNYSHIQVSLQPYQVLSRGAEEEKAETARLVSENIVSECKLNYKAQCSHNTCIIRA